MSTEQKVNLAHQITTYVNTLLLGLVAFFSIQLYFQFQTTRDKVYSQETTILVHTYQIKDMTDRLASHMRDDEEKFDK